MIFESFTKPERYIACPACGRSEHRVSHLKPGTSFGPWYCKAAGCYEGFIGEVVDDVRIDITLIGERAIPVVVRLRSTEPFEFTTTATRFSSTPDAEVPGNLTYFFEQHTCPSNALRHAIDVLDLDGRNDPHGIFRYVSFAQETGEAETT